MNKYNILKHEQSKNMVGFAYAESKEHVIILAKAEGIVFKPCWFIKLVEEKVLAEAAIEIYSGIL